MATAVTEDRAWGVSCCSHEDPDLLWPEKLWLEKKKRDDSDGSLASLCFNSKLQSEQKIEIFVCIDLQRGSFWISHCCNRGLGVGRELLQL